MSMSLLIKTTIKMIEYVTFKAEEEKYFIESRKGAGKV